MNRRVLLFAIVLTLLIAACGGSSDTGNTGTTVQLDESEIPTDLKQVAKLTCFQLGGATAATAVPIVSGAVSKAASIGYTGSELRDALRAVCPDVIGPLESDATVSSLFEG